MQKKTSKDREKHVLRHWLKNFSDNLLFCQKLSNFISTCSNLAKVIFFIEAKGHQINYERPYFCGNICLLFHEEEWTTSSLDQLEVLDASTGIEKMVSNIHFPFWGTASRNICPRLTSWALWQGMTSDQFTTSRLFTYRASVKLKMLHGLHQLSTCFIRISNIKCWTSLFSRYLVVKDFDSYRKVSSFT